MERATADVNQPTWRSADVNRLLRERGRDQQTTDC
jgi:hypothetical protein